MTQQQEIASDIDQRNNSVHETVEFLQPEQNSAVPEVIVTEENNTNQITAETVTAQSIAPESTVSLSPSGGSESGDSSLSLDKGVESPSDNESLDLYWTGNAPRLISIPEIALQFPRSGIIPDQVVVSFRVLPDGTVSSVSLKAPGSGHLNLDRQIRSFVAQLLFEETDLENRSREGSLTLNLSAMEDGRW